MRVLIVMAAMGLLAACQTTSGGYTSGIKQAVDCQRSMIWTTAEVKPPKDGHCKVETAKGQVTATSHTAYFTGAALGRWWESEVQYVQPHKGFYAIATPADEALKQWTTVREQASRLRHIGIAEADGRTYDLYAFTTEDNAAECLGFVGYGGLKDAGYADRVDGFVCHQAGSRLDAMLKQKVAELVVR